MSEFIYKAFDFISDFEMKLINFKQRNQVQLCNILYLVNCKYWNKLLSLSYNINPVLRKIYKHDKLLCLIRVKDGVPHAINKPAIIIFDDLGNEHERRYYNSGQLYRISAMENNKIKLDSYYSDQNGKHVLHREDGPAETRYFEDTIHGTYLIYKEKYYINGILHNVNGPADILYNSSGQIYIKEYYLNGKEYNEPYIIDNWIDYCKNIDRLKIYN